MQIKFFAEKKKSNELYFLMISQRYANILPH